MTFKSAERIRETSTTTGTGTYTLGGAPIGYQSVSTIGANNYGPFFVTDGTNWEVIIGQYLSGPDRLTRDAVLASSNAGSAVNWAAGTRTVRSGWPAWLAVPRYSTKATGGGVGTTVLTQSEQRAHVIEFTGALTGNRIIEVDATPWGPTVHHNNTSGAFTLTVRVTGQTGVTVPQGKRVLLYCDGTDVRAAITDFPASGLALSGLLDLSAAGAGQIAFPATQNVSGGANTLDDYEKGTWTVSLGGSTTYTGRSGLYTKIGNVAYVAVDLTVNAIGTGSQIQISGLPFTVNGTNYSGIALAVLTGSATAVVSASVRADKSATTLTMFSATAAAANLSGSFNIFQNGTILQASGCYSV